MLARASSNSDMRYYDLRISNAAGQVYQPTATANGFTLGNGPTTFTSFVNGKTILGALNLEIDMPVAPFNTPQGQGIIRVWGVGLPMIGQASNLNGANFTLSAGMKPGLPLATAATNQAGIIAQGLIFQAFGNWQGVNQTLDLICYPGAAQQDQDIQFYWPAGMSLSTALSATFTQAFSQFNLKSDTSQIANITQQSDGSHHATSLQQLADYIQQRSQQIGSATFGESYSGVQIKIVGNTISAYDNSIQSAPLQLAFQDLIGQPTWMSPGTISFKAVMRSDIALGSLIKFPAGISAPFALTTAGAAAPNAPSNSKTAFQGTFNVTELHHFGNFRQADAESWNTSFTAVPVPAS
jgi:hypothetical protein